jgi:hypothetical protein
MIKKEKYKIVYKSHEGKWDSWSFYSHKETVNFKNFLLETYKYSDIKIFHYDLSDKVGIAQCVFNAIGLIDMSKISKEAYA